MRVTHVIEINETQNNVQLMPHAIGYIDTMIHKCHQDIRYGKCVAFSNPTSNWMCHTYYIHHRFTCVVLDAFV